MARKHTYSDIDMSFTPNPVTGDIGKKYDSNAIKKSIESLILTKFNERKYNSALGSFVAGLQFENMDPMTGVLIEESIKQLVFNFEPRASVTSVDVTADPDSNEVSANINYIETVTKEPVQLRLVLARTR